MLESDYSMAFKKSVACNRLFANQCAFRAPTGLGCAGCLAWVNTRDELDAIRSRWNNTGCGRCVRLCPAIVCRALSNGVCQGQVGQPGTCVDQGPMPQP